MIRRPTRRLPALALLALALLLAACAQQPSPTTGTLVGPAGGLVSSADGNASLSVPAGALDTERTVALVPTTDLPAAPDGEAWEPGLAYRIVVDGVDAFAVAASLTLGSGGDAAAAERNEASLQSAVFKTYSIPIAGPVGPPLDDCTRFGDAVSCAVVATGTYAVASTVPTIAGPTCDAPGDAKVWLAKVSPAWGYPGNWSPSGSPSLGASFVVCSGVRWAPELNIFGVAVGSVYVQDGISVKLGSYDLSVGGSIGAFGPITGTGKLKMTGSGVAVLGSLPHVTVASGADVRLSGPTIADHLTNFGTFRVEPDQTLTVVGVLDLQEGSTLVNDGTVRYCGAITGSGTVVGAMPVATTCP